MSSSSSVTDTRSAALYARALKVLPGGVNSPVRAMRAIGRDPIFVERAEGAELCDVDGNRYIDYVCSWGPLIHGHAHPAIVAAVTEAAQHGTTFGAPTEREVALAELVTVARAVRRHAADDLVGDRGSDERDPPRARRDGPREAAQVRRRLPRPRRRPARRGRQSGLATAALPASPGVPEAATANTIIVPWNDPDARAGRPRPRTSSPRCCASPTRPTWGSSRRRRASSSCCARAPTPTGRCSSSTR